MKTAQELFDHVVAALVKQGRPSVIPFGDTEMTCVYNGPEGLACAAAHCVPENLRPLLEERTSWRFQSQFLVKSVGNMALVIDLQGAHDRRTSGLITWWRESWVTQMYYVAEKHALSTELLTELATEEWRNSDV